MIINELHLKSYSKKLLRCNQKILITLCNSYIYVFASGLFNGIIGSQNFLKALSKVGELI